MRNLHSITPTLPDIIIAQIWYQRTKSSYKTYKFARVYMSEYDPSRRFVGASPIRISRTGDFNYNEYYHWMWESFRLESWISYGRPPIDMSTVEIIGQ